MISMKYIHLHVHKPCSIITRTQARTHAHTHTRTHQVHPISDEHGWKNGFPSNRQSSKVWLHIGVTLIFYAVHLPVASQWNCWRSSSVGYTSCTDSWKISTTLTARQSALPHSQLFRRTFTVCPPVSYT